MKQVLLIYPHQLFEKNLEQPSTTIFLLLEEPLLFSQYSFHKQKLVLHRASMKHHEEELTRKGHKVYYLENKDLSTYTSIKQLLKSTDAHSVSYYDVIDDWLEQKIINELGKTVKLIKHESPMFLSDMDFLNNQFASKKHYSMATFYMAQRKRLSILVHDAKPVGGKWSFDMENRKKLPKGHLPPEPWFPAEGKWVAEAKEYVQKNFPDNTGSMEHFQYAVTRKDAKKCLHDFLHNRFALFGPYEDAISSNHAFNYHSVLTPYLNIGLLTPKEVVDEVMNYSMENGIELNSTEGFIRQVIGWREFMRAIYIFKGRRERTCNFWDHERKLPYSFWKATTGILPIDTTIRRLHEHAYTHHIERLMIMGNFMLLCEINPDDIYRWFMEMYIDSYDWVMVPNVYSMSQYSGGGTSTTKPYISGSNYVLKMSDYKKGEWTEIWDGLYWRFIGKHKQFFQENPRLSQMTLHLNKMGNEKYNNHVATAEAFLEKLDGER